MPRRGEDDRDGRLRLQWFDSTDDLSGRGFERIDLGVLLHSHVSRDVVDVLTIGGRFGHQQIVRFHALSQDALQHIVG